tara:strand:+ start:361 stop:699 length:339 start_codon:yes stop_codon:yes gene_type:complete
MRYKLKENRKPLRFIHIPVNNEPTPEQIKWYYILNTLDLLTTIHALKSYPDVKEGNIFLGENPSNQELITHKLIFAPLIEQNFRKEQMTFMNFALTLTVLNNIIVMTKYDAW